MGPGLHGVLGLGVRADLLLAQLHNELKLLALLGMLVPRLLDFLLEFLIVVNEILILYFELSDLIVASLFLNADFFELGLVLFDLGAQLGHVGVLLDLVDDSEEVHGLFKVVGGVD
jgi:hypothetical protein